MANTHHNGKIIMANYSNKHGAKFAFDAFLAPASVVALRYISKRRYTTPFETRSF